MDFLHFQRHIPKYVRAIPARPVDRGDRSRPARARNIDGLRLCLDDDGSLGDCGNGDRGRDDVGDVVSLVVDGDGRRGDGGDGLGVARTLDQLVGRREPTTGQEIRQHDEILETEGAAYGMGRTANLPLYSTSKTCKSNSTHSHAVGWHASPP